MPRVHFQRCITGARSFVFRQSIGGFYERYEDTRVIFDGSTMGWIDEDAIRFLAELIGTVLALAKFIKNGAGPGLIAPWVSELERLADAAE